MLARAVEPFAIYGGILLLAIGAGVGGGSMVYQEWPAASQPAARTLPPGSTARLIYRKGQREFIVYPDRGSNLLKGPAWLTETPPPGTLGNSVLAGHRDTHFRFLKDVRLGDEFDLETEDGRFTYAVTEIAVVSPSNRKRLMNQPGRMLTLVTCYPFYYVGPAPRRYIVRAEYVAGMPNSPVKVSPGEMQ